MTHQKGFTIIELLVATVVFSMLVLAVTYGILQIGRTYYKGITSSKTQQAARNIMDDMSRTIQFSSSNPSMVTASGSGQTGRVCIGDTRYTYKLDRQLVDSGPTTDQAIHILVRDTSPGCSSNRDLSLAVTGSDRELMDPSMRIGNLNVQIINAAAKLIKIDVTVISGERDLLQDTNSDGVMDKCANVRAGTQFCSVSTLSTVVQQRL